MFNAHKRSGADEARPCLDRIAGTCKYLRRDLARQCHSVLPPARWRAVALVKSVGGRGAALRRNGGKKRLPILAGALVQWLVRKPTTTGVEHGLRASARLFPNRRWKLSQDARLADINPCRRVLSQMCKAMPSIMQLASGGSLLKMQVAALSLVKNGRVQKRPRNKKTRTETRFFELRRQSSTTRAGKQQQHGATKTLNCS